MWNGCVVKAPPKECAHLDLWAFPAPALLEIPKHYDHNPYHEQEELSFLGTPISKLQLACGSAHSVSPSSSSSKAESSLKHLGSKNLSGSGRQLWDLGLVSLGCGVGYLPSLKIE